MKKIILAVIALVTLMPLCAMQPISTIDELIERLHSVARYSSSAKYSVLLPQASDDIIYEVSLQSVSTNDTLSPCKYLIDWSMNTPSGKSEGFSAYTPGSHFRYRDERLQEYHFDWDSVPFTTRDGGVQRNAQFVNLLPQYIAQQLREITQSPNYTYKFNPATTDGKTIKVEADENHNGYTARHIEYTFNSHTGYPQKIYIDSNPGEISEQEVTVTYDLSDASLIENFSEDALVTRYPEVFAKYRTSNFRVENLPGTALPGFSLPTPTGERYSRNRNEALLSPTILVMLDPSVASTRQTITDVRQTISLLPMNVDVMWVFVTNNIDVIDDLVGPLQVGETTLMNGRSLARDTGVNSYPTLIFVNRDGKISSVQLGYNKNLPEIVMQKSLLMTK